MKLNTLDDGIIWILDHSIDRGDSSVLLQNLIEESSYVENLDAIFLKLGRYISEFSCNVPEKEVFISNVLQILSDLIQAHGIGDTICLTLARTLLFLLVDENCSITNIKSAINVFQSVLKNPSIISSIVIDESLEGTLQILGRKIPYIGDYECQALLFEALYRITCTENREYWSNIWFCDAKAKTMFLNLDPQAFESNCRKALNYINSHQSDRRVFSFLIYSVQFGSYELSKPHGCDFWVDFNYDSQSISFYCSEVSANESAEDSGLWETIVIAPSSVKSYFIKDKQGTKLKELTLSLTSPCYTLITCSNITNPAFYSYIIKLTFWGILDIHPHLEKIYGKDKYEKKDTLSQHENSNHSDVPEVREDVDNYISQASLLSHFKISHTSDVIKVEETSEACSNMIRPQRKASVSVPVSVDLYDYEEFVPATEENQRVKKISQISEIIGITPEDLVLENSRNHSCKNIYNSSEAIHLEIFEVNDPKLMEKGNAEARDTSRKRSITDEDVQNTAKDKRLKVYDEFPASDDDFHQPAYRDIRKRKRNLPSREAAVKATRENKRILDLQSEVTCDIIEILRDNDDFPKDPVRLSEKKRKNPKIYNPWQTDTETGSSEVSWLKQNKSHLFESPKKSYAEWKKRGKKQQKSLIKKKRKLPVVVVSDMNNAVSNDESGGKYKSLGLSDLDNFNLTIEKTKGRSYSIMKDLESDFQSISTSSRKKSLPTSLKLDTEKNSNMKNNMLQKDTLRKSGIQVTKLHIDNIDASKNLNEENFNNKYIDRRVISDKSDNCSHDIFEMENISKKQLNASKSIQTLNDNHSAYVRSNSVAELDELIHSKKRSESEKMVQMENELIYASEIGADDDFTSPVNDFRKETEGKQIILKRFLQSIAEHSASVSDETMNPETENDMDITSLHLSNFSVANKTESTCYNDNVEKETEYAHNSENNLQVQSTEINKSIKDKIGEVRKFKGFESSSKNKAKKLKLLSASEDFSKNENISTKHKSLNSKDFKNITIDSLCSKLSTVKAKSSKNVGSHNFINTKRKKPDFASEQHNSEKSSKKAKQHKSLKDFSDNSFSSLHTKITSSSEYDKEWFDKIILVLSKDTDILTRKLLGTVQKCFFEYSDKMGALRENIVKTAELVEMPFTQDYKSNKLKNFIKRCRIIRKEVEKSLKEMHTTGKGYFEAEAKYYWKLRQKHIKASRKYIFNMQKVEKDAVQKLETNILSKTKGFFRRFLKQIDSA